MPTTRNKTDNKQHWPAKINQSVGTRKEKKRKGGISVSFEHAPKQVAKNLREAVKVSPTDLQECCKGRACDREVFPGHGQAAVETRGVQEEHHHRHGEAEAPRRHAEHALRAAETGAVGHHGDHGAPHR